MMTDFVKTFLEKNIKLIKVKAWNYIFHRWYNASIDLWLDDADEFKELLNVLSMIHYEPDMSQRESVITDNVRSIIEDAISNNDNREYKNFIGLAEIESKLNSHLGYDLKDIHRLIKYTAFDLGLHETEFYGRGFSWNGS